MKDVRNDELFRLSLKPVLNPEETVRLEALLAAHPAARAQWEEDRALGRALQSLPDVPVSTSFSARVLQAVDDLEDALTKRHRRSPVRLWLRAFWAGAFWPRVSWATAAVLLALFGTYEYRVSKRTQLAHDVAFISQDVAKLPSAAVLQDFDAIDQLRQASAVSDDDLLIALQ
jgi:anti-sigma factor RsiW